jgi:hypothetical protein
MSYLDEEVIEDFKKYNISLTILCEAEHDLIVKKINENIPFSGSQIAWGALSNNAYLGAASLQVTLMSLAEKINLRTKDSILIVGDSTDNAYAVSIKDLPLALHVFSTIPQHTYILQQKMDWIACISFEGDTYFSDL